LTENPAKMRAEWIRLPSSTSNRRRVRLTRRCLWQRLNCAQAISGISVCLVDEPCASAEPIEAVGDHAAELATACGGGELGAAGALGLCAASGSRAAAGGLGASHRRRPDQLGPLLRVQYVRVAQVSDRSSVRQPRGDER
jgi:hypothetical protein